MIELERNQGIAPTTDLSEAQAMSSLTSVRDLVSRNCSTAPALPKAIGLTVLILVMLYCSAALDNSVDGSLELHKHSTWRPFASWISDLGTGAFIALAGVASASVLFSMGRSQAVSQVSLIAGAGLATGTIASLLRVLIGRTRPHAGVAPGVYGFSYHGHCIIGRYQFSSFPSGHSATVWGLAVAAWFVDRRLGLLAGAYALLVSWSRLANGCHHFSDVLAGGILGMVAAPPILRFLGRLMDLGTVKLSADSRK